MKIPFFSRPKAETKASAAYSMHFTSGQPVWKTTNYNAYVKEGYCQNVVVFQAINRLAIAVSTIQWQAKRGKEVLSDAPILALMENPNPMQSGVEFWRAVISYLYLSGDSYIERAVQGNRLLELWPLRPDRIKIIPGMSGLPRAFEYEVNNRKKQFPNDIITGDGDIRHIKLFNPVSDWYGQSPMSAGSYAIDQHNESMNWLQSLLQNSARPSGALSLPVDSRLSDTQFQELKRQIEDLYSGANNAGRPMLLEGGLDWKPMGFSPDDMTITEIKDSAARDISLAFGVPPLLLNIPGDTTYANYREARLGFYEDTVIPLVTYIAQELNSWLEAYMAGARLAPDIDAIEAVAEKRKGIWEMADSSDELTVDEARALKGYPPLEDAEKGKLLLAELRSTTRGHEETEPQEEGGQNGPEPLPGA